MPGVDDHIKVDHIEYLVGWKMRDVSESREQNEEWMKEE
jgi:hypothetical protein